MRQGRQSRPAPPRGRWISFHRAPRFAESDLEYSLIIRIAVAILMIFNLNTFAGDKISGWKYAGESHGIRFFFKKSHKPESGEKILLKVENTLSSTVGVYFRVRDTDWQHRFEITVPAMDADSTHSYALEESASVQFPFIDEIYVETSDNRITGF